MTISFTLFWVVNSPNICKTTLNRKCPFQTHFCHKSCLTIDISTKRNFTIVSDSGPTLWHMWLKCGICPYKRKISEKLFNNSENARPLTHLTVQNWPKYTFLKFSKYIAHVWWHIALHVCMIKTSPVHFLFFAFQLCVKFPLH